VDADVLQSTPEAPSQYRRLAAGIERLVLDGRIGAGVRFPSERRVAQALGCSRVTVTAALGLLRERGLLISRTGAGSWTAVPAGPARASGAWSSRAQGAEVDIDLSAAQQAVPPELLRSAVEGAASRLSAYLDQRSPDLQGLRDLRRLVADTYAARGLPTRPEQILITCGAQQAFDLVLRTHLRPQDRVVVDDPTYPGLIDVLRRGGHRADVVPVDDEDGWRSGDLLDAYGTGRSRLGIHVFDHHNPTGQRLPDRARAELARVCERHDVVLVVDETLADLADAADTSAGPLPMAAHLPSAVSIGSLSKTHWSGLRIGWVRADRRTLRRLADAHATYTQGTPLLDQLIAVELLHDTEPHLLALRHRLTQQRQALAAALATALPQWKPNRPAGGVSHARSSNGRRQQACAWPPAAPLARSNSTTNAFACRLSCPPESSKKPSDDLPVSSPRAKQRPAGDG
jgi:DNA-binding transcriptional MocR family regulator